MRNKSKYLEFLESKEKGEIKENNIFFDLKKSENTKKKYIEKSKKMDKENIKERFKSCFNDLILNLEESCSEEKCSEWLRSSEYEAEDDKNYLVCWMKADRKFSAPHRAYYVEEEGHFFSLENNNSHPLVVDIFMELPDPNEKQ